MKNIVILSAVLTGSIFGAEKSPDLQSKYYKTEEIPTPQGEVIEIGSLALMGKDQLVVGSRRGQLWLLSGIYNTDVTKIKWRKIFDGAHEPLGMFVKDGWIHFTDRDAYARLGDTDGNGSYESYEVISNQWGMNGDYHEYNFGSKPDENGDVWIAHCLTGSAKASTQWRGWVQKVKPDGTTTPIASGVRSPGGIGFNAVGDAFYTDNQGLWNGTSCLKHIKEGSFTGNPTGNKFYKNAPHMGPAPQKPKENSRIVKEAKRIKEYVPPAVQIPHGKVGQSPTAIVSDFTEGKFGIFPDQLLIGEQTHSEVQRIYLEKVKGVYQGAVWKLLGQFRAGLVAMELSDSGMLFVGGTNRGWASRGGKDFTLERVKWTGEKPLEMHRINATPKGFTITFTEPVDEKSVIKEKCSVEAWTYQYRSGYGSPEVDKITPKLTKFTLDDTNTVLTLELDKLTQGHIHHIKLEGVKTNKGKPLWHKDVYYTLNEIPE